MEDAPDEAVATASSVASHRETAAALIMQSRSQKLSLHAPLRPSGISLLHHRDGGGEGDRRQGSLDATAHLYAASVQRPQTQHAGGVSGGRRLVSSGSTAGGTGGLWLTDNVRRPSTRGGSSKATVSSGGGGSAPGGFEKGYDGSIQPTEDTSHAPVTLLESQPPQPTNSSTHRSGEILSMLTKRTTSEGSDAVTPSGVMELLMASNSNLRPHTQHLSSRDAAIVSERDRHRQELDGAWKRLHKAQESAAETQRQHEQSKSHLQRALLHICVLDEMSARSALVANELQCRQEQLLLPIAASAWSHVCPPPIVEPPVIRDSDVLRALRSTEKMVSLLHAELRRRDHSWDPLQFEKDHSSELMLAATGGQQGTAAAGGCRRIPAAFNGLILRHAIASCEATAAAAITAGRAQAFLRASTSSNMQSESTIPARPSTQPGRKRRVASAAV